MLKQLNEELKRETEQVTETEQSAGNLAAVLDDLTEELKVTKRQRIREIMKSQSRKPPSRRCTTRWKLTSKKDRRHQPSD